MGGLSQKSHVRERLTSKCLDAIGIEAKYPKESNECLKENEGIRNIAIACLALEKGLSYGTDEGPVQMQVYKQLVDIFEKQNNCIVKDDEYSKDRMTNFGYVFKMAYRLAERKTITPKNVNNASPSKASLYKVGFKAFKNQLDISSLKGEQSKAARMDKAFVRELNKFAKNSSTLGNYCCIPEYLRVVDEKYYEGGSLNRAKAISLRLDWADGVGIYVNDQFALLLEWFRSAKLTSCEEKLVKKWKRMMFLDCCEGYYLQAAWHYEQAALTEDYEYSLCQFTKYLENVNRAIKLRTQQILKATREMKNKDVTKKS